MHRIDTEGHNGNLFDDSTPPRTLVDDEILNAIQEELCLTVESPESAQALVKGTWTQLLRAIRKISAYRDTNLLINPHFAVWARNAGSDTITGITGKYIPDRFFCIAGTGGSATVSQQSFSLGGANAKRGTGFFARWVQSVSASTAPTIEQRLAGIEAFDAQKLTISFWARVSTGSIQVRPRIRQSFGVGGSADVNTDGTLITVNTTWTRYSQTIDVPTITGKTVGTGTPYTAATVLLPTSATFTFEIDCVQVEYGEEVTEFRVRLNDADERESYFWKSYGPGQAPGASAVLGAKYGHHQGGVNIYNAQVFENMRTIPSVTWYSTGGTAGRIEAPFGTDRIVDRTDFTHKTSSGVPVIQGSDPGSVPFRAHLTLESEL